MEKMCGLYTKRAKFAWNTAVMASNPLCSFKVTFEMCLYDTVLFYYFPLNTTIGVSHMLLIAMGTVLPCLVICHICSEVKKQLSIEHMIQHCTVS
jgi:hypothetical protein